MNLIKLLIRQRRFIIKNSTNFIMLQEKKPTDINHAPAPNQKSNDIERLAEGDQNFDYTEFTNKSEEYYLKWQDVNLRVLETNVEKSKKGDKHPTKDILRNVSGYAKSGECLAIMGGSGAGKSTLLNVLSDRIIINKDMVLEGEVKLNNRPFIWEEYKQTTGFVMQRDIFFQEQTVKEVFDFNVMMKSPHLSQKEKERKEKAMVEMLKLQKAEHNYIGGKFIKGISGGEKRRLNLGAELLSDPKILFLDEPTSGLDSYTSFIIIDNLRRLARAKNMIIVYTIHQPSMEIAQRFDNLMILHRGRVMYFGRYIDTVDYFAELGFSAPDTKNPIEFFIEVAVKGSGETAQLFFDRYDKQIKPMINDVIDKVPNNTIKFDVKNASFCRQFAVLSNRSFKNFLRNPTIFKAISIQTIILSVVFSLMYGGLEPINPSKPLSISNRIGAFFALSINLFNIYFEQTLIICKLSSYFRA